MGSSVIVNRQFYNFSFNFKDIIPLFFDITLKKLSFNSYLFFFSQRPAHPKLVKQVLALSYYQLYFFFKTANHHKKRPQICFSAIKTLPITSNFPNSQILSHLFLISQSVSKPTIFIAKFLISVLQYNQNQNRYHMQVIHKVESFFDKETERKLALIFGDDAGDKLDFPNLKKYHELIKALLEKIPEEIIQKFKDSIKDKKENVLDAFQEWAEERKEPPTPEQVNHLFENWGETVSTNLQSIYYPTIELGSNYQADLNTIREQIDKLLDFVKANFDGPKKRVRGSGIRHSWANVFSDPEQYLVSFYPYGVATGSSFKLERWARAMLKVDEDLQKEGVEHLNMLKKVGEFTDGTGVKKTLVKIGAGVSNEQMRLWCVKNGVQYKSNVIMVEVNLCGAIGTCSHGAGISTQTLADYVYAIQFIDHTGTRQTISKADRPDLIASAASNLGLLGLTIFVTLEMEDLQVVEFVPRSTYKDYIIPYPKSFSTAQKLARKLRPEYILWHLINKDVDDNWNNNMKKFKAAINNTYCEWFYFPIQGFKVFENNWNEVGRVADLGPNVEQKIKQNNPNATYYPDYPPPVIKKLSELSLFAGQVLINNEETQSAVNIFMRVPFAFFPKEDVYVNYPDGVHFQRGIQNMKVRDVEFEINIPTKVTAGKRELDYDLVQRIWWAALEYVEDKKEDINIALEMRLFKGSNATLAPEIGYEYVCSIEILRSLALTEQQQQKWRHHALQIFEIWKNLTDSAGLPVVIRPHWGKEWNDVPEIRDHVFRDQDMKGHFRTFLDDYQKIAEHCKFDKVENLRTFSNQLYRDLLNNANGKGSVL